MPTLGVLGLILAILLTLFGAIVFACDRVPPSGRHAFGVVRSAPVSACENKTSAQDTYWAEVPDDVRPSRVRPYLLVYLREAEAERTTEFRACEWPVEDPEHTVSRVSRALVAV